MAAEMKIGPRDVITRMLKMESGLRRCARIMMFMDRKQFVDTLIALPDDVVISLAREMAKLKAQIQNMELERETVKKELGQIANIIDLTPPDPQGAKEFAFLGELDDSTLISLGTTLDERTFAAVVCNAPVERGSLLLGAIGSRRLRRDLIEEMTKLSAKDRRQAHDLADEIRGSIASGYNSLRDRLGVVETRMIKKQLTRVLTRDDTSGRTDFSKLKMLETKRHTKESLEGGSSSGHRSAGSLKSYASKEQTVSLRAMLEAADEFDLQMWLGNVPADHIALALAKDDGALTRIIGNNLSPRRWREVEQEMDKLKDVTEDRVQGAQKAIVNRIQSMK